MATMTGTVTLQTGVQFEGVAGSGHRLTTDGPVEAGGRNGGFRPMELMLLGLGCCMAYDMLHILRRMRQNVTGYKINLTGRRAEESPTVYIEVTLEHIVAGESISEEVMLRALDLAENKYCSASAMFAKTAKLTHKFHIEEVARPADA
ncbi:MAG TPA: OsmC family protein [Candidatus Acidoferrum sp.]|nr:OsmC family protein [Candidatus Acidoferrum sp.]